MRAAMMIVFAIDVAKTWILDAPKVSLFYRFTH
jgi:hypothetical protein